MQSKQKLSNDPFNISHPPIETLCRPIHPGNFACLHDPRSGVTHQVVCSLCKSDLRHYLNTRGGWFNLSSPSWPSYMYSLPLSLKHHPKFNCVTLVILDSNHLTFIFCAQRKKMVYIHDIICHIYFMNSRKYTCTPFLIQ